jgi:hypothetical protein
MSTVRTTITLPEDLHEELKLLALKHKLSLSDVVVEKIQGRKVVRKKKKSLEKEIQDTIAFFRKVAQEGDPIKDAAKVVREERDRDNG